MFKFHFADGTVATLHTWDLPDQLDNASSLQAILDWLFMIKDDGSKERVSGWLWDKIDLYGDLVSIDKC